MRRRTLLATVGSALLAGCGDFQEATTSAPEAVEAEQRIPDGVGPIDDIGIQGEIGVEGGVDVQPVDDIGVDQDIEIADDIGVQADVDFGGADQLEGQGLDENGDPIERNPRAERLIQQARGQLSSAIEAYTSFAGPDATLTDVNPTVSDFDAVDVTREVRPARRLLERASSSATMGQRTMIMALGQCASFLENAAMVDGKLADAYEDFEFAWDRLVAETYPQVEQARHRFQSDLDDAESAKDALERVTSMRMMAAFEEISAEMYRTKIRQFDLCLSTLDQFDGGLGHFRSALHKTDTAAGLSEDERYRSAANRLVTATASAGTTTQRFRTVSSLTGLRGEALERSLVPRTMEQTLHDLERHARARHNENRILADEALEAAEQHYSSNDTVAGLNVWNGFGFN